MATRERTVSVTLRTVAPAKINWTLEVLHARPDGYHELRSVLQTIDLCDSVTAVEAGDIELRLTGEPGALGDEPVGENFAYRAAMALRQRCGAERGARIVLEKRVPVAAGLGGGSSDAAAVLRTLNELWGAMLPLPELRTIAATLGSDPPFFVFGGTAAVRGRGEEVEPLPDAVAPLLLLAMPREQHRGEKTAAMFAELTPADYSEGYVTIGLGETAVAGHQIVDDGLNNVFERVAATLEPETANAMTALRAIGCTPHLAGAGPSFFLLVENEAQATPLADRIDELGFEARMVHTLSREDATRIERV